MIKPAKRPSAPAIRCATNTRKSTDEGLDQEFNSLDAQRESAEAFIKSQEHEGSVCLPDRHYEGGFSGRKIERTSLKRLLADVEAGKNDRVMIATNNIRASAAAVRVATCIPIERRVHLLQTQQMK